MQQYITIGDFTAEEKGDLGFKKGEILTIIDARSVLLNNQLLNYKETQLPPGYVGGPCSCLFVFVYCAFTLQLNLLLKMLHIKTEETLFALNDQNH